MAIPPPDDEPQLPLWPDVEPETAPETVREPVFAPTYARAQERPVPLPPASRFGRFRQALADVWAKPWGKVLYVAGGTLIVGAVVVWNLLFFGMPNLPPTRDLWAFNRQPAVQFVDANGRILATRGPMYGQIVRAADLPDYVSQAFVAAEDQRFFEHGGVDMQSITRAVVANVSSGHTEQGGSTITQQLVKNVLLDDRRTFRRKAQEARLAQQLEERLSKDEILDLYLNRIYLGSNAYGIEAAAQVYFGVPAADLTLPQAAFLAILPKAPSRFAEQKTGPEAAERQRYVLDQMVESGFITAAQAAAAKAEPLVFVDEAQRPGLSGYVMDAAMEEARRVLPDMPPDAVIQVTVDPALQRRAEQSLEQALRVRGLGAKEAAVVVMEPTGAVKALVGGRDYQTSQFNRVTQAHRQPGSVFKTFVYATALEQGLEPSTIRDDAPVTIGNWQPRNYEDNYRGPITLAKALAISSNSVAAQVGTQVGPRRVADLARRFGIESPLSAYPSIALGSDEVTLLEITGAYGVLANGGLRTQPHLVAAIRNLRGEVLYTAPETQGERVYAQQSVETLTGMLSNVVRFGTGLQAQVPGWEVAGKTGTSQSWRDAWFVGYSSRYVAGVWIGNDDERAMRHVTGGGAAAALFSRVMVAAHRGARPAGLPGYELGAMWLDSGFDEGFSFDENGELVWPDDVGDPDMPEAGTLDEQLRAPDDEEAEPAPKEDEEAEPAREAKAPRDRLPSETLTLPQ
jgi:penicillin-binding protein 1A